MNPRYYRFKSRTYSIRHAVFALFCLLLGCFISRHIPCSNHPMAAFLAIMILLTASFVVIKHGKHRISPLCWCCGLIVFLLSLGMILSGSSGVISTAFWASLATVCYMVSAEYGNQIEAGFSDYIGLDIFRSVILPFRALPALFDALFSSYAAKGARYFGKILLGIAFAVIPTIIIAALLSFDSSFREVLGNILSFNTNIPFARIPEICIGIFIGMYLFGLFVASKAGYHKGSLTVEGCQARFAKMKVLPQLTALTATLPILFIYVVFFISQWKYYISGFTGILPEDFSYAEYAREGFFQLCTVSVINLIIIVTLSLFLRRGLSDKAPVLKLLTCIFCFFTLVLIATAVAKLVMYIDMYGMTQKRLLAMWAMIVIALVFLIIAVGQFLRRFKTAAICLCVVGILFIILCLCNTNALIAHYNVDRYLSGTLQQLDINAMKELGVSAVPALTKLVNSTNTVTDLNLHWNIMEHLRNVARGYTQSDFNILNYGIPDYTAIHALRELGLLQ